MKVILIRKGGSSAGGGRVKVIWLAVRCYTAGIQWTIYRHRCTGEGPNKATGAAYTQVAIVDVSSEEEIEEKP
jgi:hypothetical protein